MISFLRPIGHPRLIFAIAGVATHCIQFFCPDKLSTYKYLLIFYQSKIKAA